MAYYGYHPVQNVDELENKNTYIPINNLDVSEYMTLVEEIRNNMPDGKSLVVLLAKRSVFDACHLYSLEEKDYRWPVVIDKQYNGIKVIRFI